MCFYKMQISNLNLPSMHDVFLRVISENYYGNLLLDRLVKQKNKNAKDFETVIEKILMASRREHVRKMNPAERV